MRAHRRFNFAIAKFISTSYDRFSEYRRSQSGNWDRSRNAYPSLIPRSLITLTLITGLIFHLHQKLIVRVRFRLEKSMPCGLFGTSTWNVKLGEKNGVRNVVLGRDRSLTWRVRPRQRVGLLGQCKKLSKSMAKSESVNPRYICALHFNMKL